MPRGPSSQRGPGVSVGWFGFSLLPLPTARPPAPPRAPTATATEQTAAKTAPAPRRAAAGEAQAGVQGSAHGGGQRRGERALGSGWPRPQGRTGGRAAGHSPRAGPSRASTRRPSHPRNSDVLTARAALASGEQGSVLQRAGAGAGTPPHKRRLCGAGDPQVDCFNRSGTADPSPSEPGTSAPVAAVQMHPRAPRKGRPGLDRDAPGRARQLGPGDDPRPSPRL